MVDPIVLTPAMQRSTDDCAIACLAMFLGKTYADVAGCIRLGPSFTGMSPGQISRVAARLGVPLRRQQARHLTSDAIAMLVVERPSEAHCVLYIKDTIYNPATGDWWTDPEAFYATSGYTPVQFWSRRT